MTKGPVSGALVSACYKEVEQVGACLLLNNCTVRAAWKRKIAESELQNGKILLPEKELLSSMNDKTDM